MKTNRLTSPSNSRPDEPARTSSFCRPVAVAAILLLTGFAARGATQTWNPNGDGTGGSGTWDAGVTPDWDSGVVWTNSDDALFTGTGGTVSVVDPVANSVTFQAAGPYLLTGGTLTLSGPDIILTSTVGMGSNVTIASDISAQSLSLSGTGVLTLTGTTTASGLVTDELSSLTVSGGGSVSSGAVNISPDVGSNASVTITGPGSTWSMGGNLQMAYQGASATITIQNGGAISGQNAYIEDAASVTVTGTGSAWSNSGTVDIGNSGSTGLVISAGGTVSDGAATIAGFQYSSGSASVSGTGSQWNTSGSFTVGGAGHGSLAITAGGLVADGNGSVGGSVGSSGTVGISGTGSQWTSTGNLLVANAGTGALSISGGGSASAFLTAVGSQAGSSGTLTLSGSGSSIASAKVLRIGDAGTGSLTISSGAIATDTNGVIANLPGSQGTATVTGSGSKWSDSGDQFVGDEGTGSLTVTNAGTVADSGNGWIGYAPRSNGLVTITGSGSTWKSSSIYVGVSGTGTLGLTNGGAINVANIKVGDNAGSNGSVTVSGSGSNLSGALNVGASGVGTLAVSNGAAINAPNVAIGSNAGSNGAITISGSGSSLYCDGSISAGLSGTGSLTITGGAIVTDLDSSFGVNAGSVGIVTVSGNDSKLSIENALPYIGDAGIGIVNVTDGGLVRAVNGNVTIGGGGPNGQGALNVSGTGSTFAIAVRGSLVVVSGTLTVVDGGTISEYYGGINLDSNAVLQVAGKPIFSTGSVNSTGATIRAVGDGFFPALQIGGGATTFDSNGFTLTSSGGISGTSGIIKIGAGTLDLAQSNNSYSGGTTVDSGTLQLGAANPLGSTSNPLVLNGGVLDMHGYTATVGSLNGVAGTGIVSTGISKSNLTVGGTGNSVFAGDINGGPEGVALSANHGSLDLTGSNNLQANFIAGSHAAVQINSGGQTSDITSTIQGSASVAVSGSGSSWTNSNSLYVGYSGTGSLAVTAGAQVSDVTGYLGNGATASGSASIDDSTWSNGGSFYVGDLGSGTLSISDSGVSTTGNTVYIGIGGTAANGTVTVAGTGSRLTAGNALYVGYSGTGTLAVSNGGIASSGGPAAIGDLPGANGLVTVTGSGSKLNVGGNLNIGGPASGTLSITGGGMVGVIGTTTIGSLGTLQIDPASAIATGALTVNGGTIRTLGAYYYGKSATLGTGGMTLDNDGYNSTFAGNFTGAGGITSTGSGSTTLTGSSTYTGSTLVNSGTLALTTSSLAHTASLGNTAIVTGSGTTFIAGFGGTNPGALVVAGATGSGTAGASLALGPGSNFIMSGSAPLTFRLQQENSFAGPAFTIGGASGSVPALTFGLGQTASDLLAVTGTVDVLGIGAAITVNPLSGDHFLTAGNYDLITGADVVGGNLFTLTDPAVVVQGTTYDLSLSESGTAEVLTVTSLGPPAEAAVNTPAHSFLSANAPQLTTAAVPEPGNLATLLGGLGVLATAFLRRRRKENRFPLI